MLAFLRKWHQAKRLPHRGRNNTFIPRLEALENRLVPSAADHIWLETAGGINTLFIQGTNLDDSASVQVDAKALVVYLDCGTGEHYTVKYKPNIDLIVFSGLDGNDTFVNNTSIACYAEGGLGNDVLIGGGGADELFGEWSMWGDTEVGGDDQLFGRGGDDMLWGNFGNDSLYGGANNDWVVGGRGNDFLFGEGGFDRVRGGDGDDYLDGGADGIADELWGGPGRDRFKSEMVYSPAYPGASWGIMWNVDWPKDFNTAEMDSYV